MLGLCLAGSKQRLLAIVHGGVGAREEQKLWLHRLLTCFEKIHKNGTLIQVYQRLDGPSKEPSHVVKKNWV
jgi:hypothetical protein